MNRFKRKDSCVVLLFWGFDYISDITEKKRRERERKKSSRRSLRAKAVLGALTEAGGYVQVLSVLQNFLQQARLMAMSVTVNFLPIAFFILWHFVKCLSWRTVLPSFGIECSNYCH